LKLPRFFPCRVGEEKGGAILKQTCFSQKRVRSYIVLALALVMFAFTISFARDSTLLQNRLLSTTESNSFAFKTYLERCFRLSTICQLFLKQQLTSVDEDKQQLLITKNSHTDYNCSTTTLLNLISIFSPSRIQI